jgi:hypothetical protein
VSARAAVLLALLLPGCFLRMAEPDPADVAWSQVRDGHTRTVNVYDGLAVNAFASALWESPELRAARVERVASWRAAPPPEVAALRAAEDAAASEFDDFTLSLFTPDRADNDLDATATTWRIALVQQSAPERRPAEVRALRVDAQLRSLYPMIGDFDVAYRIRFRREAGPLATPFTLRVAGPRGQLDFVFDPAKRPVAVTGDRPG